MIENGDTPVRSRADWVRFLGGFAVLLAVLLATSAFDATGRWGLAILAAVLVTAGVGQEARIAPWGCPGSGRGRLCAGSGSTGRARGCCCWPAPSGC